MAFPASSPSLEAIRLQASGVIRNLALTAQSWVAILQSQSVDTNWVFALLDRMKGANDALNAISAQLGQANLPALDSWAKMVTPGYTGSYTADAGTVMTAIANVITWVITNFPATPDPANPTGPAFILGYTFNADGT